MHFSADFQCGKVHIETFCGWIVNPLCVGYFLNRIWVHPFLWSVEWFSRCETPLRRLLWRACPAAPCSTLGHCDRRHGGRGVFQLGRLLKKPEKDQWKRISVLLQGFQSWPADWWDFAYFAWDLSFAAMACIVLIERVTWNASYCSTWSWKAELLRLEAESLLLAMRRGMLEVWSVCQDGHERFFTGGGTLLGFRLWNDSNAWWLRKSVVGADLMVYLSRHIQRCEPQATFNFPCFDMSPAVGINWGRSLILESLRSSQSCGQLGSPSVRQNFRARMFQCIFVSPPFVRLWKWQNVKTASQTAETLTSMILMNFAYLTLAAPPLIIPQTVWLTLGVLMVREKGGVLDWRWRTQFVVNIVLSCFFSGNSPTFGVAAGLAARDRVVILVLSGSSTSCMFLLCGNSRTFGLAAMGVNGFYMVILIVSASWTFWW